MFATVHHGDMTFTITNNGLEIERLGCDCLQCTDIKYVIITESYITIRLPACAINIKIKAASERANGIKLK